MSGLFPLLGSLCVLLIGLFMTLRPYAYIGKGTPPANDPRTVRYFGIFFIILGAVPLALSLLKFASE